MAIGRSEDWDNPWDAMVLLRHHCRVWDPIRAPHLGQRRSVPHTKAGHMTAIDQNVISRCRPCEAVHICVQRASPPKQKPIAPTASAKTWRRFDASSLRRKSPPEGSSPQLDRPIILDDAQQP